MTVNLNVQVTIALIHFSPAGKDNFYRIWLGSLPGGPPAILFKKVLDGFFQEGAKGSVNIDGQVLELFN